MAQSDQPVRIAEVFVKYRQIAPWLVIGDVACTRLIAPRCAIRIKAPWQVADLFLARIIIERQRHGHERSKILRGGAVIQLHPQVFVIDGDAYLPTFLERGCVNHVAVAGAFIHHVFPCLIDARCGNNLDLRRNAVLRAIVYNFLRFLHVADE